MSKELSYGLLKDITKRLYIVNEKLGGYVESGMINQTEGGLLSSLISEIESSIKNTMEKLTDESTTAEH